MGERKNRSRSQKTILDEAVRCIYCDNAPSSIEHMPPLAMFQGRARPSGMEYPACKKCNNGTSASDLVASFVAHISPVDDDRDWRTSAAQRFVPNLKRKAPGLLAEMLGQASKQRWLWSKNGLLQRSHEIHGSGPILKKHLDVFSAKLAMALFYEHMGRPLPIGGMVFTTWFLNAGMTQAVANALLSIMPNFAELRQGSKRVTDQFGYRYNTDDREILAALAGFHGNLHVLAIATDNVAHYRSLATQAHIVVSRPGDFY